MNRAIIEDHDADLVCRSDLETRVYRIEQDNKVAGWVTGMIQYKDWFCYGPDRRVKPGRYKTMREAMEHLKDSA